MRDDLTDIFFETGERDPLKAAQRDMKRPLPKRFYTEVAVQPLAEGFGIALDGKPVHTPARVRLVVPTRRLAEALAEEWRAQGAEIDPAKMPKTRLVNTALDGVSREKQAVAEEIAKFAGSDLVCYRADAPQSLIAEQDAAWNPVLDFFREKFSVRFACSQGVVFVAQPEESLAAVLGAVEEQAASADGALRLAALHVMTTLTGSALIALALVRGGLDFDSAWAAAHVDEDFQARLWGPDDEALARRDARKAEMRSALEVLEALDG
ncbi:ATP12 family protein [uncultured Rhodoblastus sp.]|uniref:ATP12 family chaperone protein n=1 Tax=uncultured Rhodoblastus sp. TaxID=543037 RepID=UPI0025E12C39|nr:ATP12 family protein [uncultured Rhodoblastus sp.]